MAFMSRRLHAPLAAGWLAAGFGAGTRPGTLSPRRAPKAGTGSSRSRAALTGGSGSSLKLKTGPSASSRSSTRPAKTATTGPTAPPGCAPSTRARRLVAAAGGPDRTAQIVCRLDVCVSKRATDGSRSRPRIRGDVSRDARGAARRRSLQPLRRVRQQAGPLRRGAPALRRGGGRAELWPAGGTGRWRR